MKSVIPFLLTIAILQAHPQQAGSSAGATRATDSVDTVVKRCLARDYTTTTEGVKRISWVNPTAEDYAAIGALGDPAVDPLARDLGSRNDFVQLLAVKFLGYLDTSKATTALEQATSSNRWVIVRLSAMDALWKHSGDEGHIWVKRMKNDSDPLVAKRALDLASLVPDE